MTKLPAIKPMRIFTRFRSMALVVASLAVLAGCSGKAAPDTAMTTSPTGLWTGKQDSGTIVDIQQGGQLRMTRAGKETLGTWTESSQGKLHVSLDGADYDVPFMRKDLTMTMTLPGDNQPSEFEQM